MSRSKIIQPLILLTKNLLFIFSLLLMLVTFKGCELFEDEEHCQYETVESKIWLPDQHPSFYRISLDGGFIRHRIFFEFNYSSDPSVSNFQLQNSCPYGVIAVNIKIKEKGLGATDIHSYYGQIKEIKYIRGSTGVRKVYNHVQTIFFRKISENEYVPDQVLTNIVELTGFLDNGPKNFIVTLGVSMYKLNELEYNKAYETWAKENIANIEFSANYVKWD